MAHINLHIELNAVIVAVTPASAGYEPQVLLDKTLALPSGPFATEHRTLEQGLRNWVQAQSGQPIGYIEQLYTFADRDRTARAAVDDMRTVSIGYLALVQAAEKMSAQAPLWSCWYRHCPWEDHRGGYPPMITSVILPGLKLWKNTTTEKVLQQQRAQRIAIAFPNDQRHWNEELVLQRYELLWEARLVEESLHDTKAAQNLAPLGIAMAHDHRRILATAIARLRAKIKYRPVVFELMPETFTLLQLQSAVEALAGLRLHKQNFRRLVESQGLVEETGALTRGGSGRPAKLFAFRREILQERAVAGTKLTRTS